MWPVCAVAALSGASKKNRLQVAGLARTMMDGTAEVAYRSHRFTVADFLRMEKTGLFHPEARVELIEGEIIDMAPIGSPHAGTVMFLAQRLGESVGRRAILSVHCPIVLDDFSLPQPDIAVLRPRADYYRQSHPRPDDILLLIEVADTTLPFDRNKKLPVYARAGIVETWIVDVEHSAFHVFRRPRDGRYASEQVLVAPDAISIAAFPGITVDLAGFFQQ
jgi:Uma2 family endonuclease